MKLYLCTLYEEKISPETKFNILKLNECDNIEVVPLLIKCGKFQKGVKDRNTPDREEVYWRNQYLRRVPHNEFLLILDSDEIIFGYLKEGLNYILNEMIRDDRIVANIHEIRPDGESRVRPRIIRKKKGMEYKGKHDEIMYRKKSILYNKDTAIRVDFLKFLHYKTSGFFKITKKNAKDVQVTDADRKAFKH